VWPRAATSVRRLKEEIRLYAHYRVAEALAKKSADAAGAYTAGLNADATWAQIERLLKFVRAADLRGGGGRSSKR
jgi:hypothetical protein